MNTYRILFFLVCFTPSLAYAFPVAEGVNALATLLGVLTSVVAGVSPKFIFNKKNNKSTFIALVLFIILVIVSVSLLFTSLKQAEEIENAIQSRPVLLNNVNQSSYIEGEYDFDNYKDYINNNLNLLLYVNDYYRGLYPGYTILNIDYKDGDLSQLPSQENIISFDIKNDDLLNLVNEKNGKLIIVSNNFLKAANVSQETFKASGYKLPIIRDYSINYVDDKKYLNETLINKGVELSDEDIFNATLLDLRSLEDVIQTHTLENAKVLSIGDLYNMTNEEISNALSKYNNPIFISFNEQDYQVAERRLEKVENIKYSYLKGGLSKHFDNDNTLTPKYINLGRYLEPSFVMEEYAKNDNIRFICTETKYCLDNLPKEDTLIFSYRDLGKESAKKEIQSLSSDNRYILISNNQETDGNALLTGYWLSDSDKVFLGTLPLPDRFSLEYIRHRLIGDDTTSLSQYREDFVKQNIVNYNLLNKVTSFAIKNIGWFATFFILGLLFRLLLIRFQINIYNCYYKYKSNAFLTLFSSFVIISLILFAFNVLNNLLINYGVIPLKELMLLNNSNLKDYLAIIFSLMIVIQAYITFPIKKKSFYVITTIVSAIFFLGYIHELNIPILTFLTASELVSLGFQIPFYLKFKKLYSLHKKGLFLETFRYMPDVPEKWLLVNDFIKTKGVLIELSKYHEVKNKVNNYAKQYKKCIVRSCSSNKEENVLAGYYNSKVCLYTDVELVINEFIESGLDYVWLQPYHETKCNGVAQSWYKSKKTMMIIVGDKDSATEGTKDATIKVINRKKIFLGKNKRVLNLIKKIESYYKQPVIIEFGMTKLGIILYQVRMMNQDEIISIQLEKYKLAENFLTKASYMTGSILELISNKDFMFFKGYLYTKNKSKYKKLFVNESDLNKINARLDNVEEELSENLSPIALSSKIEDLLMIYKNIYAITQSLIAPKTSTNMLKNTYLTRDGNDLEISNTWDIKSNENFNKIMSYRDVTHELIVRVNYLLNKSISSYCSSINNLWDIKIENLFSEVITNVPAIYDNLPLDHNLSNSVIVPGNISGTVFLIDKSKSIDENLLLLDNEKKWILVSDEIGSGWVKHLDKFVGVISIYGHPLSHLSISAKQLNLPYRKVLSLPENNEEINF